MTFPRSFPYKPVLFLFWLVVQAALWYFNGINTGGESLRFIREASLLENGQPFTSPAFYLYIGQILLITFVHANGFGYTLIIVFQMLLNCWALNLFYQFMKRRHGSKKVAFFAGMLLVVCIPYQLYNTFLYTESIFFSLLLVFTMLLLSVKRWSPVKILMIVSLLVLLCFIRPTGLFVALATILYLAFRLKNINWLLKIPVLLIGTAFFLYAIHMLLKTGGGINTLSPFIYEYIICDVPQTENAKKLFLDEGSEGLNALAFYITHNPGHFAQLAVKKTIAFFGLYRPWYSTSHNLLLMFYFFALYIMMVVALFRRGITPSVIFTLCIIFIFWLFVIFSCDEWHNRFFLTFTPHLIICAMGIFGSKKLNEKTTGRMRTDRNQSPPLI